MVRSIVKPLSYIHDYPNEGKVIVLLHGFLSSKRYWRRLIPLLRAKGYRVITIDLLGFGNAPKPSYLSYTYNDHIQHIHTALQQLHLSAPIILAGHSMGALLALRYARQYPDDTADICLINPPMYIHPEQARATLRDTGFVYRLLLDSQYRHLLWVLLRKIGPFSNHTRYSREGSLENVITLAKFFSDLETATHRTLLLIGKKDRSIYLDNIRHKTMNKNISVIIEASGHHTAVTHTNELAGHINAFLSS